MSNHLKITDKSGYNPKWESPEALQEDIDRYFDSLMPEEPAFIEGFCVFVKISTQRFYANYSKKDNFSDTIERLQDRIKARLLKLTALGFTKTPFGIFMLKVLGYIEAGSDNKDSNNKPITINLIEAPKKESNE